MKVTDIKQQVKTRGRYSVYVDGQYSFSLSETALLESGVRIGKELSDTELEAMKQLSGTDKLYNRCLALLARRQRSDWEIRSYLQRHAATPEQVEEIVNKLTKLGYINDADFAKRWVENRRLLKSVSAKKLKLELRQKRVPDAIVTQVLAEDETDENQVIKELVDKKRTQTRYQDDIKLMQYLTRQGFSYDDVKRAVKGE